MNLDIIKSAAKAIGFYESPTYFQNEPKPDYYDFFAWEKGGIGRRRGSNSDSVMFFGKLKEELIDTLPKKIIYLQGVFEAYDIKDGVLCFPNSPKLYNRCIKWVGELNKNLKYLYSDYCFYPPSGIEYVKIDYRGIPTVYKIKIIKFLVSFIKDFLVNKNQDTFTNKTEITNKFLNTISIEHE